MDKMTENILLTSNLYQEERDYWIEKMTGSYMLTGIPVDHTNGETGRKEICKQLRKDAIKQLYDLCENDSIKLYGALLTGVINLLNKYSGYDDILVGVPQFKTEANEKNELNLYPIRTEFSKTGTVNDLLKSVEKSILDLKTYNDFSFQTIMKLVHNTDYENQRLQTTVLLDKVHMISQEYDSDIIIAFLTEGDDIKVLVTYNPGYFLETTITQVLTHLEQVYDVLFKNLDIACKGLAIYKKEEIDKAVVSFNEVERDFTYTKLAHQMFEEQVNKTPYNTAVILHDKEITYDEINKKSNQMAYYLRAKGITLGSVVAIMLDRSFDLMITMVAVLKTGGAFLLIDPEYPLERIKYMLENSGTDLLLTKNKFILYVATTCKKIAMDELDLKDMSVTNPDYQINPESAAYLEYTSGSTGVPKGVKINHNSFTNLMYALKERIDYKNVESILALATVTFDIFLLESFFPLTQGIKVVMGSEEEINNLQSLYELIESKKVEAIQITPSRLKMLLQNLDGNQNLNQVKIFMIGGEIFTPDLFEYLKQKTNAKIYNLYGPVEVAIWSTIKEITDIKHITVGKPIANTYIYILDSNHEPVPVGIPGEVCISGIGLATGYINNPELTDKKFILNPLKPEYIKKGINEQIYCTGDIAKWLPDGEIQFIGRADYQIKLRGYRIELGEVEEVLLKHENILNAAVVVKTGKDEEKHLYAYVVTDEVLTSKELKEYMANYLPIYMIPSFFIFMKVLPYTLNGKIDRKTLISLDDEVERESFYAPPTTELENTLVAIWEKVFKTDKIGIDDEFDEIGGDSLIAMKLELELEMSGYEVTNVEIIKQGTIRKLAKYLETL